MSIELKVPEIGESITEVEIGGWLKRAGETVKKDDPVVTLESEKATVELPAPEAGTLAKILKQQGEVAKVGEVIAYLERDGHGEGTARKVKAEAPAAAAHPAETGSRFEKPDMPVAKDQKRPLTPSLSPSEGERVPARAGEGKANEPGTERKPEAPRESKHPKDSEPRAAQAEPAAKEKPRSQRQLEEGNVTRSALEEKAQVTMPIQAPAGSDREEEVVPMSRLRRTVAQRLIEAQHNAALLTTFNEIDMGGVMALRKEYGEAFQQKYHVKLGFMSFFVKASVDALKQFPAINAEVRGTDIIYHNYFDIGVAIGSGKGLVVPVLRRAERMSFAEIELAIGDFGRRAKENKLKPDELQGGTFTISNGGVYGSLLSTPIVNPPQSGVLGMHAIQERPVAHEGQVVIRPMMYVALTYDHRIVDGREAVTFLKRVKEAIENPARMLIEV